jgi:hypothetical protein
MRSLLMSFALAVGALGISMATPTQARADDFRGAAALTSATTTPNWWYGGRYWRGGFYGGRAFYPGWGGYSYGVYPGGGVRYRSYYPGYYGGWGYPGYYGGWGSYGFYRPGFYRW